MTENKPFIFYTSGSTGEPKVVKKSYECVLQEGQDLADFFKFSKDTVFVSTVNSEYMYGTTFTVMLPEVLGCRVDADRVVYPEDMKDYENTYLFQHLLFLKSLQNTSLILKISL